METSPSPQTEKGVNFAILFSLTLYINSKLYSNNSWLAVRNSFSSKNTALFGHSINRYLPHWQLKHFVFCTIIRIISANQN
ncbi:unnamed protein product [Prunus armeniaca]|uniref:Uncharacterized protein n=1 Tax=Prunus armeniaca TaxID=36596 RepID=A0A6J5VVM0_PRUAR|nr:unnamed protein product [Prunus armeniaca]CAB4292091.1 unnamed protein product [Prunus armeniaca]